MIHASLGWGLDVRRSARAHPMSYGPFALSDIHCGITATATAAATASIFLSLSLSLSLRQLAVEERREKREPDKINDFHVRVKTQEERGRRSQTAA